ncbi:MAG: RnfABCDGE type electron transport complex subunit B, partial [Gammaproteobacteria bacterium]
MLPAALTLILGCLLFGGLRLCKRGRAARAQTTLVERIEAVLPQTQCQRCGYPACRPYAEAVARGERDLNRCAPGGDATIRALARLLGRSPRPLDPEVGNAAPAARAVIDEGPCIGCTLCIQACPVDAIVGAPGLMHTVLAQICTGCELCVAPCPVDCIAIVPATEPSARARPWVTGRRR